MVRSSMGMVRIRFQTVVIACIAAASGGATTSIVQAGPPLESELRAALSHLPQREAVVGACVVDLTAGRTIFELGADQPLMPASTMKLFSISASLAELGPQFQFQTILGFDGTNLVVVGDGDPGFGDEKIHHRHGESPNATFERWIDALQQAGVTAIRGDLIYDESIFDEQRIHSTWERGDLDNWYAAPVSGLNINDNCLDIRVTPARSRGSSMLVSMTPENHLARIINTAVAGGRGEPALNHAFDSMEYKISGHCPRAWTFGPVSFPDPGLLFADSLHTALARRGITVAGKIRQARVRQADGSLPQTIRIIAKHATPLTDCLTRAGKDSQNLFAECLLKRAGYAWAKRQGLSDPRGSWTNGGHAVAGLLGRLHVSADGLNVADGSGLSRSNHCTARQLCGLLAASYSQPFGPTLHDSLAVAGIDGSLKKRLKNSDGRIHAKTGTMHGIRTLAGYVDGDNAPRFAFAVMFNGYKGGAGPYKEIQDRFCRILENECETQAVGGSRTLTAVPGR
ncbi:MAG: D-alanyl-D-alanine carboxypeptidase/D-alanyl-D-alanine-endopeptidase [Planctomycetes bacterium]|nr:D-alanyl-D-alanine carboxypeptidase/D-alanyl-D-alanine-endopeptidase [Planctomycetota bacterium]